MASRMMHYAIAHHLAETLPLGDFDRFLLGELLPDAYGTGRNTHRSHLRLDLPEGRRTYDLTRFRAQFARELEQDDMYLGYYLHLVQDIYFRNFTYGTYRWDSAVPGNVQGLHGDYRRLNGFLARRYGLTPRLAVPETLAGEPIAELYPFDLSRLEQDFQGDFQPCPAGDYFFFTPEMGEEYIRIALAASLREAEALKQGRGHLDEMAMAWNTRVGQT